MGTKADTIAEQVSLRRLSDNEFESNYLPDQMGNLANIAYGGCSLACAIQAAQMQLPSAPNSPFHLYSATGYYLGPTLIDRQVKCSVRQIRATRTFQTLAVDVSQDLGEGKGHRTVLTTTVDFQMAEPAAIFEYTTRPRGTYAKLDDQPTGKEAAQKLVDRGIVSQQVVDFRNKQFNLMERLFEGKPCKEGIFAQNLSGVAKAASTTQDHLSIVDKTSADYLRARHTLVSQADHVSALLFAMDGAVAFMPLSHDHKFLDDVAACSSLDFAVRIFSNKIDMNKWHLREWTTIAAAVGRTYSEARFWDEEGNLVGSMTQQSIMRPKAPAKSSL